MPEKGARKESGSTEERTTLQLNPVSYKITLIYLGDKRIKRDPAPAGATPLPVVDVPPPYRCKYELRRRGGGDGADAVLDPLHIIPSVVRKGMDDPESVNAATPGQAPIVNPPPNDIVYKVMVTDNHGTRTSENLDLLGEDGDDKSNIKYYRDRGWIPDIVPAVPFRVIVRKFVGHTEVGVDKNLKVAVEVKDPHEEFDQNDGRRRAFLEDFFKEYNRTKGDPDPGDDNAPQWSKGHRPADGSVKATSVLRKTAYKDKPAIDTGPAENDVLDFGADLSPAPAFKEKLAAFDIKQVEQDGIKVGVADFTFVPWPVSGDNYRFLITLVDGDKDVRDTKENGADVLLKDDHGLPIDKPRAYTTGRFVLWRKAEFTMAVLANGCTEADVDWDFIIAGYRKLFMEVVKPARILHLTREAWKFHIRQMFPTVAGINDDANYSAVNYARSIYPPNVAATLSQGDAMTRVESFARRAIAKGCMDAGIPNPDSAFAKAKQADGNGLFMFMCKCTEMGGILGAYFGDRMFWFRKPDNDPVLNATSTCAHEFAHLKSIRHSYTSGPYLNFVSGGTTTYTRIIDALRNCQMLDHDGKDAYACLQAYTRPYDAQPCAMCALALRFWDRVEIQKQARYRQKLLDRHGAVIPAAVRNLGGGNFDIIPLTGPVNMGVNNFLYLLALGPETAYDGRGLPNQRGRLNFSFAPRGEGTYWTASSACVQISPVNHNADVQALQVKGVSPGTAVITYRSGKNPTTSVTVNIA